MNDLISILMPVYNEGPYISQAIDSLLKDDYRNLQICISDNCSNDNTWEIIETFAKIDSRIIIHRHEHAVHPFLNWEKTLKMSTGKYVYTFHGDDYLINGFFGEAMRILEDNKSIVGVINRINCFDDSTESVINAYPRDENWVKKINVQGINFLRLYFKNMNNDDMSYGIFKRDDFEEVWKLIKFKNLETNLIWLVIGLLNSNRFGIGIKYVYKPYLMKRYNKIKRPNNSYANAEKIKTNYVFRYFINWLGSISTCKNFYQSKIFTNKELLFFLTRFKFHEGNKFFDFPLLFSILFCPFTPILRRFKIKSESSN